MFLLFRSLLLLYPTTYRAKFAGEMLSVLTDRRADLQHRPVRHILFFARESGGLVLGALREHLRQFRVPQQFPSFTNRRSFMRSDFRFPKSTVTLMTLILLCIIVAIEKAESIQRSIAATNPGTSVDNFSIVGTLFSLLLLVAAIALIVWAVLFAFRRTGLHRLERLDFSKAPRPKATLTN